MRHQKRKIDRERICRGNEKGDGESRRTFDHHPLVEERSLLSSLVAFWPALDIERERERGRGRITAHRVRGRWNASWREIECECLKRRKEKVAARRGRTVVNDE